ncbi:MAG TPA: relaxase MobL [Pyrinomonadaceae bacterium]|nr:relaxase MobL [Pyrinomonadaceae bacterium]HMP67100.1 relaxase MobL [Pyrinomonadaceae bacterium]
MRVIASVQSKRGSSRGLIHYIAHSKIDTTQEPEKGRELFNAFADDLSVQSANNSIKADIVRGRPSNDELHHLVLSFRPDDYHALGSTEKQRRAALKETTRAAMRRLENALNADRVSWAAAVHLNTENPHVHIAIQKEFLTRDLETRSMTKIPREALPHFEPRDGEKILTPGILIEAATEKMEHLIAGDRERVRPSEKGRARNESLSLLHRKTAVETGSEVGKETTEERDILRRGILAEYELRRIESNIEILADHRDKLRFRVSDPVSGQKRRLSLRDLEQRRTVSDPDPDASAERQIRTILLKMLAKEEAAMEHIQKVAADPIRESRRLKAQYRKNGWKLPTPSLTKDDLDKLQDHCLDSSNIRKFSYLESIRTELERKHEIGPRSKEDLDRLAAQEIISDMRKQLYKKNYTDLNDRQYYRVVDVSDKRLSLAQIDREKDVSRNPVLVFTHKLKETAMRLAGKRRDPVVETGYDRLRNDIVNNLNEHLSGIRKDQKNEENKAKVLGKILTTNAERITGEPVYSTEQLTEMETVSLRLKMKQYYDKSWNDQRALIESAGSDSPASRKLMKGNPSADLNEHKLRIVAGRALAREIVAKVELAKAKEDLKTFTESKRFQKFAIADKKSGNVAFLSLHDVELPRRSSLLDRAMEELFEGRENRTLRRAVTSLVKGREQRLREEVSAAKDIMTSTARNASEFKQSSFFGLRAEPIYSPVFTSSEVRLLEMRAVNTRDPKEAARLRAVLESAVEQPVRSLKEILRDFEDPQTTYTQEREHDPAVQKAPDRTAVVTSEDQAKVQAKAEKFKEPKFLGHSR